MDSRTRRLAAVWFADIVGFTRLSARDEAAALGLVDLFHRVAREQIEQHDGTVVKFLGDGVLAYAPSAASAIDAVSSLRSAFESESAASGQPSFLRIGAHIGDLVVTPDGDVFGDGVNVASRLQESAVPGQILISEDLWRQCRQRVELEFTARGRRHLKGLDEPVWIYELSPSDSTHPVDAGPVGGDLGHDRSVAVLPFDVLAVSDEAGFLALGIHNDLLTELSKVPDLTVISRTSVMGYRGTDKPIPQIARELNVGTIVEGTLQSAGQRVRLNVQLIDGETDIHRWADYFDRELTTESLFEIQTELTERIVKSLQAELAPRSPEGEGGPATVSIEAYRLVAEGRMQFDRKTEEGLTRAIELFKQAVEADPSYGSAWVGLADSLAIMADYGYGDREALVEEAGSAADKALELLPDSAGPHTSLGLIAEALQDAPTALREYELTVRLEPNHPDAHSWHAWVSLVIGKGEQGLKSAARSVELNPLSAEAVSNLALAHLAVGDPKQAVIEARRAAELSTFTAAAYYEGLALYDLGRFDEAVSVLTPLSLLVAGELTTPWASMGPDAALALAQIAADRREDALGTFRSIDPDEYPFEAGIVLAGLGDIEEAFAHFSRVDNVPYGPALIFHHHFRDVWARLEDDPRFVELAQRVDASWKVEPT